MSNYEGYIVYISDTETTGLDPVQNEIVELSIARIRLDHKLEAEYDQKTWYLKALKPETISDEALAINGHKREDILHQSKFGRETYREPSEIVPEVELWIMEDNMSAVDRIFAGQNPKFDLDFMKALWKKTGSPGTFPFETTNDNRILDIKQLAIMIDLCTGRRRLHYNLSALVKALGVKKGKAHKAEEDVRMTADVLLSMLRPIQATVIDSFQAAYPE